MTIPPFSPYMRDGTKYSENPWSPEHPERVMNISCAENIYLWDKFKAKYPKFCTLHEADNMYAISCAGRKYLRESLAAFMTKEVCKTPIAYNELTIFCGSGASMDVLGSTLFDNGDAYIVITPGFVKFSRDMSLRNGAVMYKADISENNYIVTEEILEKTRQQAEKEGHHVKMLIVTNPSNPTGYVYSEEELRMMLAWCRKHNLHLFSDEIYALSTKPRELCTNGEHEFVSYAKIIEGDSKTDDVTVLWGMSKDFGLSGFRFSLLWTKNTDMLRSFAELAHFCEVSSVCQTVITNMLNDEEYINDHVKTLRDSVWKGRKIAEDFFTENGIPFIPGTAGYFCWIDLNEYMIGDTFEAEEELYNYIYEHGKVIICPVSYYINSNNKQGKSFFAKKAGWFRMVFTCYSHEHLKLALDRLKKALHERKLDMENPSKRRHQFHTFHLFADSCLFYSILSFCILLFNSRFQNVRLIETG